MFVSFPLRFYFFLNSSAFKTYYSWKFSSDAEEGAFLKKADKRNGTYVEKQFKYSEHKRMARCSFLLICYGSCHVWLGHCVKWDSFSSLSIHFIEAGFVSLFTYVTFCMKSPTVESKCWSLFFFLLDTDVCSHGKTISFEHLFSQHENYLLILNNSGFEIKFEHILN